MNDLAALLQSRGVSNVIPNQDELVDFLESGKRRLYLGIDPTATSIHIGHAVPLRLLQLFSELGHSVTFLVGDFTALIGDNSDKDSERPVLTRDDIEQNLVDYKTQASKVLDFDKIEIRYNSEWLSRLDFEDILGLCQQFSAGEFVSRELIKKRLNDGKRVGLHELLYPVMQGYDMYYMDMDIQIGGTDQTFNMQAGRTLQKALRGKASYVLAMEFLMGTDGLKMSKTGGNAVWLNDSAEDMYGKIMSISDDLIVNYARLGTRWKADRVAEISQALAEGTHPMELKKQVAYEITRDLHDESEAQRAAEKFAQTVQKKEIPDEMPEFELVHDVIGVLDLLVAASLVSSKGEGRRLVGQGGFKVNQESVTDWQTDLNLLDGDVVQVGKRKFVRIHRT